MIQSVGIVALIKLLTFAELERDRPVLRSAPAQPDLIRLNSNAILSHQPVKITDLKQSEYVLEYLELVNRQIQLR